MRVAVRLQGESDKRIDLETEYDRRRMASTTKADLHDAVRDVL